MIYEKTEIPDLLRDKETNALINTNVEALMAYKSKKQQLLEMIETKNKVNRLENEMAEIKNLLQKLVEKI